MSRKKILDNIRSNKPALTTLPEVPSFIPDASEKILDIFREHVEAGAGQCVSLREHTTPLTWIGKHFPSATRRASTVPGVYSQINLDHIRNPADLETVELAVISAGLGVAENGAVWVTEADCVHRALPFITQHLVVVLHPAAVVWNMHQAYQKIRIDETGFGVFIAGPSKTADIEQSLVVGAQGSRSFTVLLTSNT